MADLKSKQIKFPLTGTNVVSSSAQISTDISGSLSAAAIVGLGANIVSGSIDGTLSSSAQIATDISGSFTGELSGSGIKFVGGGVSGSQASTGSFGRIDAADGFYHSNDTANETYINFPTGDKIDIVAGGVNFIHAWQRDSDFNKLIFNEDNTDTDIIFRSANGSNNKLLYLDASADNIGIKEGVPSASLHIAGNLWVSGSSGHVTASGDISASGDVTADNLYTSQYIYHTDDSNTYLNFTPDRLRFQIGGISYIDLNDASAAPHDITFNDGGNNVDFIIKGTSNNPLFKTDASTNRIGMFGVGTPTADLHIDGNLWVSGSKNHITASGNISTDGQIKFNQTAATGVTYTLNNISSTLSSDHSLGFTIASGSSSLDSILKVSGSHVGGFVGINKPATDVLTKALMVEGDVSSSANITANNFSGIFNGALSSSAQISTDISGSLSTAAVLGLGAGIISGSSSNSSLTTAVVDEGAGILSGSAQIASDISGSLSAASIVALGANIVSGSIDGTISSSQQIASDVSGSFNKGFEFTGKISGSSTSTGSFGLIESDGDLNISGRLAHAGDPDTRILFADDDINITVGNVNMIDFTQDTISEVTFNEAGADVDFRIETANDSKALYINAGDDTIQLGSSANTHVTASGNISGSAGNILGFASASFSNVDAPHIKATSVHGTILTATQGTIDHDSLSGFVANEHINHTSVTMTAGAGLTGGGDISSTRTLAVGQGTGVTVNANDVAIGQDVGTDQDVEFASITTTGNITAQGDIIAENYIVSSSVTHMTSSAISGSSIFGDTQDDTHQFTGSLFVTGSTFNIDENGSVSSSASGSFLNVKVSDNIGITGKLTLPNITDVSASIASAVAGGDDMGNHTATQDLDMDGNDIFDIGHISGSGNISGSGGNILGYKSGSFQQLDAGVISASSVQATNLTGLVGTATQGTIDHDSLANFVANEHVDHSGVTLTAGDGLSGGGTIASNRSFAVDATVLRTTGDSVISSSAQLAGDISGSFSTAAVVGLGAGIISGSSSNSNLTTAIVKEGAGILSGSAQIAGDISGSLSAAAIVGIGAGVISASAMVDHDSTTNFVANEHINHTSVSITAGDGLTGGGTIASTRTLAVGEGTGVTVNANDVAIGQDVATTANVKFANITGSTISASADIIADSGSFSYLDIEGDLTSSVGHFDKVIVGADGIDTAGDLILDGDGGDIIFKDDGTEFGRMTQLLGSLTIKVGASATNAIIFSGEGDMIAGDNSIALNSVSASGAISGSSSGKIFGFASGSFLTNLGVGTDTPAESIEVIGSVSSSASGSFLNVNASNNVNATNLYGTVLTATQGTINHDSLANFVANEHIDHSSVSVTAGDGLTGGGTIAANRTLAVGQGTGVTVNANDIAIGQAVETDSNVQFANIIATATASLAKISGSLIESEGDFTLDSSGDIILDADGTDIILKDGGTSFGSFKRASSDFIIKAETADKDILFKGTDDSTTITALTLDMSEGGNAQFLGNISGSQIEASGDIIAFGSSDRNLKDNIEPIENPLEKMDKIGGYTFDWNDKQDTYKGHDIGVVAQEIQEVLPEIVATRANGYLCVKYEKIVPLLIESIKELKQEVEDIKKNCDCLNK